MTQRISTEGIRDDVVPEFLRFRATLPMPPSINGAYMPNKRLSSTQRGIRISDEVAVWKEMAALELRKQGFNRLPERKYDLKLRFDLYTWRSDIDRGDKFVIDAVCEVLQVNDYWVNARLTEKHASTKVHERIVIEAIAFPR